jgi:murein L,D-transpeptidase YafK
MFALLKTFIISVFIILSGNEPNTNFKTTQKKYPRVRVAYAEKETTVKTILKEKELDITKLQLYIRAFKTEKKLELWGKNIADAKFKLIKTYDFCTSSGVLGTEKKAGRLSNS